MGLGLGVVRAAVQSLGGTVAFHTGNPLSPGLSVTVRVPMRVLPAPLLAALKEKLPLLIPPHAPSAASVMAPAASSTAGLTHAATDMVASLTAMLGSDRNVRGTVGFAGGGGEVEDAVQGSASGAVSGFAALRVALFLQSPALGASLARVLTAAGAHVLHCASEPEALQLVVAQRVHAVVYDAVRGDCGGDREQEPETGGSGDDEGGDEFDHDDDEAIGNEIGGAAEREWRATAAAPTAFDRMLAAAMRAMPDEFARHAVAIKLVPFGATLPSAASSLSASSPAASPAASSPFASSSLSPTAFSVSSSAASSPSALLPSEDVNSIILLRKPIDFPAMLSVRITRMHY
jgi:hypothetical protein